MTSNIENILEAERQILVYARQCLSMKSERMLAEASRRMKNRDSDVMIINWLLLRGRELDDNDSAPLFFGRIRTDENKDLHIGRRSVFDSDFEPVVIDWRSPFAKKFYQASQEEPLDLVLRRRLGFSERNELSSFDDEFFRGRNSTDNNSSAFIINEIEKSRRGPMRDIVATIQPEQDFAVRFNPLNSLVIQGGPGTGKTAIGLHRAAYVLFNNESIRRQGVLVVGPNETFLNYISMVLPALGEVNVEHISSESFLSDSAVSAAAEGGEQIKHDLRMEKVIRNAVTRGIDSDSDYVFHMTGFPRIRVSPKTISGILSEVNGRNLFLHESRSLLSTRIAMYLRREIELMGLPVSESSYRKIRANSSIKSILNSVWPISKPESILRSLLTDDAFLRVNSEGLLSSEEQLLLLSGRENYRRRSFCWTTADLYLLDEICAHFSEAVKYGHVVVDEAQDLSGMQLRAIARRVSVSATILGDLAQRTTRWGVRSWKELEGRLFVDSQEIELRNSYRVPKEILDLAASVLSDIDSRFIPSEGIRSIPNAVKYVAYCDLELQLISFIRSLDKTSGSVGIISTASWVLSFSSVLVSFGFRVDADGHLRSPSTNILVIGAQEVKGLEFDHVVLVDPNSISSIADIGSRLLYISLTRAVSRLTIFHDIDSPFPQ